MYTRKKFVYVRDSPIGGPLGRKGVEFLQGTTDSGRPLCYNAANTFGDKETCMPRFIIERNFAEQLEPTRDGVVALTQVNADVGIQWLFSFLSADKKKTYCLYEAPNAEAIRDAARRLNIPADVIIEVDSEIRPEAFLR